MGCVDYAPQEASRGCGSLLNTPTTIAERPCWPLIGTVSQRTYVSMVSDAQSVGRMGVTAASFQVQAPFTVGASQTCPSVQAHYPHHLPPQHSPPHPVLPGVLLKAQAQWIHLSEMAVG